MIDPKKAAMFEHLVKLLETESQDDWADEFGASGGKTTLPPQAS